MLRLIAHTFKVYAGLKPMTDPTMPAEIDPVLAALEPLGSWFYQSIGE